MESLGDGSPCPFPDDFTESFIQFIFIELNMKLRFMNICFLFALFFQVSIAQEMTELRTTKKIKGKRVIKVEMDFKYVSGKKT